MKNYKKMSAGLNFRIVSIVLVTMLAVTTLWAKPKVEYAPFKSENPNATVFECEYIKGYDEGLYIIDDIDNYERYEIETSVFTVYGWQKKKGGWEKLGEYKPSKNDYREEEKILQDDSDKYTHYAVEYEGAVENSLIFSAQGQRFANGIGFMDSCMVISISISEDYKKRIDEKRAAEEAEKERLAAEERAKEKAKRNAELDAKAKALAKGYVFHGIDENERNRKLFTGGALETGHAYYISGFVVKYGGTMAAIEYGDGFFFSSRSSAVYVDYIDQKVKGEVIEAGIITLFGATVESPLAVVVAGGKTPLHTPIVIGLVE